MAEKNLGVVSKCTLTGAKTISVSSEKYCVVNNGKKSQPDASSLCKASNARLPLPKNEAEVIAFLKLSPNETWIDIRDAVSGRNILEL